MYIAILLIGIGLIMALHELGHAIAMRFQGIEIEEVGIGMPISRVPRIRFRVRKNWPYFAIHPLLIAAYIKPTQEGISRIFLLPYKDHALIAGAGVLVNCALAIAFLALGHLVNTGSPERLPLDFLLKTFVMIAIPCGLLWVWRHELCAYAIPLAGIAVLLALIVAFALHMGNIWAPDQKNHELQKEAMLKMLEYKPEGFVLLVLGYSSLLIAIMNIAPLMPTDGGRIMALIVERTCGVRAMVIFTKVSPPLGIILFITTLIPSFNMKLMGLLPF